MNTKLPQPNWYDGPVPEKTFRSIFKWGKPNVYKHPNAGLVKIILDKLGINPQELINPSNLGLDRLPNHLPLKTLSEKNIQEIIILVGEENVSKSSDVRIRAGYGQAFFDVARLRKGQIENIPDVVVYPKNEEDVQKILNYCNRKNLPLYIASGRSSVTRGFEAVKGGITIDLTVHMNKIINFSEENQTITVQPGIFGPALEEALNNAPELFNAKRPYTCGHFPQSFEFSTVGGWVTTRGAGQNSTYYGKI